MTKALTALNVYWGELTVSPLPLELSFNYCSHGCRMCFANLGKPDRTVDMPALMRLLADYQNRDTLTARLLQEGRPVCVSNKVDPFATSNEKMSIPAIELLLDIGCGVAIQTRGGRQALDVAAVMPPSCWYISINTIDEDIRKRIEPGAPTTDSRFHLIEKLTEMGHSVSLGLNPIVPEWCPDPEPLLRRAYAAGARGAWMQGLHFSTDQIANMTAKDKQALTLPLIDRVKKRAFQPEDAEIKRIATDVAREIGFETYSMGQGQPSHYFDPFYEKYSGCYPVLIDFINLCHEAMPDGGLIEFDTFANFMTAGMPEGKLRIVDYLGATAHNIFADTKIPYYMTYRELLTILWSEVRSTFCPARWGCFAFATERAGDGFAQLTDDAGLPLMVFRRGGIPTRYMEVSLCLVAETMSQQWACPGRTRCRASRVRRPVGSGRKTRSTRESETP